MFPNNPPDPHVSLNQIIDQEVRISRGDQVLGFGRVTSLGYSEANDTGMLSLAIERNFKKSLKDGCLYNGGLWFSEQDDGLRLRRVTLDA